MIDENRTRLVGWLGEKRYKIIFVENDWDTDVLQGDFETPKDFLIAAAKRIHLQMVEDEIIEIDDNTAVYYLD